MIATMNTRLFSGCVTASIVCRDAFRTGQVLAAILR